MTQATILNGRRMSTAYCYLEPARQRQNLTIVTDALTERLLIKNGRSIGVRFSVDGQISEAHTDREVVVRAGAVNSNLENFWGFCSWFNRSRIDNLRWRRDRLTVFRIGLLCIMVNAFHGKQLHEEA